MKTADDFLDRMLREHAAVEAGDEGFTARVLGALPPRRRPWWRPALILASTGAGSAAALAFAPLGSMVLEGFADLSRLHAFTPSATTALAMLAILAVCGLVLALED